MVSRALTRERLMDSEIVLCFEVGKKKKRKKNVRNKESAPSWRRGFTAECEKKKKINIHEPLFFPTKMAPNVGRQGIQVT